MQQYTDAPVVEVQEEHNVDHTLEQMQQDIQKQLQHQLSGVDQQALTADIRSKSLSASMHTAADTDTTADEAVAADETQQLIDNIAAAAGAADSIEPAAETSATADAVPEAAAVAAAPASVASEKLSCEDDYEWQLVSPHGSVRVPSSGRYSFDQGITSPTLEVASDSGCSGSDTAASPKDELAESILGHPVLMGAASSAAPHSSRMLAGHLAATASEELHPGSDDGMDAVRAASVLSSEGGLDGLATASHVEATAVPASGVEAATSSAEPGDANAIVAAAPAGETVIEGAAEAASPAAAVEGGEAQVEAVACVEDAATVLDAEVLTGLGLIGSGLKEWREWFMESLAALVQTGRVSHAACVSYTESIQRSLHLMAKQGGLAAAAVSAAADWRVVLSSAAAVLCFAMWLRSRNESLALRAALKRRDHELSKLVMRLVSLQELLNQGQALPITRYMRYEGATAATASFM